MLRVPHGPDPVLLQLTAGDWSVIVVLLLVGLAIKALVLWWLYHDTTARGHRPHGWLIAAVFLDLPTLIVWLIVRPPHPQTDAAGPEPPHHPQEPGFAPRLHRPPTGATHEHETPQNPTDPDPTPPHDADPQTPESTHAAQNDAVRVTCPHCATNFRMARTDGPQRVQCPACGASGTLGATR